ncbi:conserved hypothetical protein [Talaromyces stipitatus ATCC 10500]|uniref:FAD-binding PCMH-type domain-containing protein n=1 Tax=Talaromyces stipitatus (strain ATCC 10500 / CBS 375.48 / QM 6759 / NRRL 1006) TaxID=441959 RepID=B8M633_TALSN|nr:uncharacterized protein TSTA_023680 [Talaromyces stipitatus ATCC 10500]EED19033.1 conserved hypothetical protein [Talaromyces stipitatus ATCC 10500]
MASFLHIGSALLLGAALVNGQTSATTATTTSLAPAQQTVSADSDSGVPLNTAETVQLTTEVLQNLTSQLNQTTVSYFDFGNATAATKRSTTGCKVFPGDWAWPIDFIWDIFDLLLGGRLIKTVPSASSCYPGWGDQSAAECAYVASVWNDSHFHMEDPTSVMWPLYQGRTCLPTGSNVTATCTLGGYPSYAVNVSNVAQIQLAVNFARNLNIRLVVKNTGHDFSGKSAGAGALSIWTHHLKSLRYIPSYSDSTYSGPAVKMGAGIQAQEVYEFAHANGITVIGGEGKTVGVAGGYILGGGHSPLGSIYGLAADQVLALEVVLPDGTFTTVTAATNPDLFWALRGGGGSTFGIVTSLVVKAYPKIGVTVGSITFGTSNVISADTFFEALKTYYSYFDAFTAAGTYVYFWVFPLGNGQYIFETHPFFAVNHTVDQFNTLIQPFVDDLSALGISVTPSGTYYDDFYDAWLAGFPLETVGSTTMLTGSRLFPRENFNNATLLNVTIAAHRQTLEQGYPILAFQMKADAPAGSVPNAANPAFRTMLMHGITSISWPATASSAEILSAMNTMTNDVLGPWRAVSPNSGAYMSESDLLEPNFQQAFYGSNYARLYSLKQKYDPCGVLYAPTAVGSEDWTVSSADGLPDQNGRLCHV